MNEFQQLGVQSPQRMVNDLLKSGYTQQELAHVMRVVQPVVSRLKRYDHTGGIAYIVGKRLEKLWMEARSKEVFEKLKPAA